MNRREYPHAAIHNEPQRLVALTDGLFATVLTLLVLDLRIPDTLTAVSTDPTAFRRWIGPHLFSYLLTFLVAGTYWLAHHRDFELVTGYDRTLLGYNLLFLLFVGLFPFSTAALGLRYSAEAFYWAIYCTNIILAGITLTLTWLYAASHGYVDPAITRLQGRRIVARRLITPGVFLVSIAAEYLFPRIFLGRYTLLLFPIILWFVDRSYHAERADHPASRLPWTDLLWRAGTVLLWLLLIGLAVWAAAS